MFRNYEKENNCLIIHDTAGFIRLTPFSNRIIRVQFSQNREFSIRCTEMILPQNVDEVSWNVVEGNVTLKYYSDEVQLIYHKDKGTLTFLDKAQEILLREPGKLPRQLETRLICEPLSPDNMETIYENSADGIKVRVIEKDKECIRQSSAYRAKQKFVFSEEEALYGLGSYEEGIYNLRGHNVPLYQHNMRAVVPVIVSTKGYGLLFDNAGLMSFHDDIYGSYLWADVADEISYYFLYGPEFDEIVAGYRFLTGKTPMLPKWAFGYIQSKERYKTQEEILDVAGEYRRRQIPLDGVVLDWMSWEGELWGQKSFDRQRFPAPDKMIEKLHEQNVHFMISIWPSMRNGGSNHEAMQRRGFLLADHFTYDAFRDEARELYWQQANDGLFCHGVDAWWCDCTEPFESDWKNAMKPEPEERMFINTDEAKKYIHPSKLNAYSLYHSKGIYEGQRKTTEQKRVVNLTRSSYAGQQRYSTITWSGDISANWQTFRNQIAGGLNFTVTGCPYWTTDIGGFFVKDGKEWFRDGDYDEGVNDLGYRELYTRWLQYGVFCPMFRSHGTDTPREVWRFGEPGEIFYDTIVKYIRLRYALLPYIYAAAGRIWLEDYTLMRCLAFDFRRDSKVYDISDQFLFGDALMVAPVTEPMYYEVGSKPLNITAKERTVYLPDGVDWFDFWTGEKIRGGQVIAAAADISKIPLYVKSGSILPLICPGQSVQDNPGAEMELRIYSGNDGEFYLYEDAGDSYDYEKGEYSTIRITWVQNERKLIIGKRSGSFHGMLSERKFVPVIVERGKGVGDTILAYSGRELLYTGQELCVIL